MNRVKKISRLYRESGSSEAKTRTTATRGATRAARKVKVTKAQLDNLTHTQLMTLARAHDIKGRSKMTKREMIRALTAYAENDAK